MSKLSFILSIIGALVLGWLLGSVFKSCNNTGQLTLPSAKVLTQIDTITRDSMIYRDRWHIRTIGEIRYNAPDPISAGSGFTHQASGTEPIEGDTALNQPYIWSAISINEGDTISVVYHHPERYADIDLSRRPDTIRTVTITKDSIGIIADHRKWGLGLHAGIGAQRADDGTIRAGFQVGLGINFNVWEP